MVNLVDIAVSASAFAKAKAVFITRKNIAMMTLTDIKSLLKVRLEPIIF